MRNGVSAATGMGGNARDGHAAVRRICIQLGGEAVRVGQKLGYKLGKVGALPYEMLARAMEGDAASYAAIATEVVEAGLRDFRGVRLEYTRVVPWGYWNLCPTL